MYFFYFLLVFIWIYLRVYAKEAAGFVNAQSNCLCLTWWTILFLPHYVDADIEYNEVPSRSCTLRSYYSKEF